MEENIQHHLGRFIYRFGFYVFLCVMVSLLLLEKLNFKLEGMEFIPLALSVIMVISNYRFRRYFLAKSILIKGKVVDQSLENGENASFISSKISYRYNNKDYQLQTKTADKWETRTKCIGDLIELQIDPNSPALARLNSSYFSERENWQWWASLGFALLWVILVRYHL